MRILHPNHGHGLLPALLGLLCWLGAAAALAADPPRVVASIPPVHSLLAELMLDVAEPELLISGGAPAQFRPTPAQRAQLLQADLLVWVGPELETGLATALAAATPRGQVLELLSMSELKVLDARGRSGARDPYFWLDTRNMLILLDELTLRLSALDPERAHRYEQNRRALQAVLAPLDRQLEFRYKDVSAKPVFLYHDTQQYFEQAYAMKVAGLVAGADGEADTAELLLLRQRLGQAPNACLFVEQGGPQAHLDLLTQGTDVRVVELDSLGFKLPPGPRLYPRLMQAHFNALQGCIAPDREPLDDPYSAAMSAAPTPHRIQARYVMRNHFGEPVSNLDFGGQFQLIYFGYTHCPDICPTSLAVMTQALNRLGPLAERIQPLFISVDPQRDTPELLRQYTAYFHPRLLGLHATPEMLARVAEQFRVRYDKYLPDGRPADQYVMDHTSALFLLGPDGEFVAKFADGLAANDLADRLQGLIGE